MESQEGPFAIARERPQVPGQVVASRRRALRTEVAQNRRHEVLVAHGRRNLLTRMQFPGELDHEGHPDGLFKEQRVAAVGAVLEEVFAVVCGDHDEGVVISAHGFEGSKKWPRTSSV